MFASSWEVLKCSKIIHKHITKREKIWSLSKIYSDWLGKIRHCNLMPGVGILKSGLKILTVGGSRVGRKEALESRHCFPRMQGSPQRDSAGRMQWDTVGTPGMGTTSQPMKNKAMVMTFPSPEPSYVSCRGPILTKPVFSPTALTA